MRKQTGIAWLSQFLQTLLIGGLFVGVRWAQGEEMISLRPVENVLLLPQLRRLKELVLLHLRRLKELAFPPFPSLADIRRLAEDGNLDAQFTLGFALVDDVSYPVARCRNRRRRRDGYLPHYKSKGFVTNQEEAEEWLKKAADRGHVRAHFEVGCLYERHDQAEANKWFQRAAELGDPDAQFCVALLHQCKGPDGHTDAVNWYRKAAEQGDIEAQRSLGDMYRDGCGVPGDYAEAARWYRRAADQGDMQAQELLGDCYYEGKGAPKDYVESARWYREAANQGAIHSQLRVGALCRDGADGFPRDYFQAATFYRKAAEQGDPEGQYALGCMYVEGQGVPFAPMEAYLWVSRAAAAETRGYQKKKFAFMAARIQKMLNKRQLADVQRLTSGLHPGQEARTSASTLTERMNMMRTVWQMGWHLAWFVPIGIVCLCLSLWNLTHTIMHVSGLVRQLGEASVGLVVSPNAYLWLGSHLLSVLTPYWFVRGIPPMFDPDSIHFKGRVFFAALSFFVMIIMLSVATLVAWGSFPIIEYPTEVYIRDYPFIPWPSTPVLLW
jgi:TPR repeat protein